MPKRRMLSEKQIEAEIVHINEKLMDLVRARQRRIDSDVVCEDEKILEFCKAMLLFVIGLGYNPIADL